MRTRIEQNKKKKQLLTSLPSCKLSGRNTRSLFALSFIVTSSGALPEPGDLGARFQATELLLQKSPGCLNSPKAVPPTALTCRMARSTSSAIPDPGVRSSKNDHPPSSPGSLPCPRCGLAANFGCERGPQQLLVCAFVFQHAEKSHGGELQDSSPATFPI